MIFEGIPHLINREQNFADQVTALTNSKSLSDAREVPDLI